MAGTLDGLFRERVQQTPQHTAYSYFDRHQQKWTDLTWQQMAQYVARWQQAIEHSSLKAGDRVAICLKNSPDWVAIDQASLGLGLVTVPLYTDDREDNIAYIIKDTGARMLVLQDAKTWQQLQNHAADFESVEYVIVMEGELNDEPVPEHIQLYTPDSWLADAGSHLSERGGNPDDLATIVYTSGTTGKPKGVMLSHRNILTVAEGAGVAVKCYHEQRLLSFLPLSHTFERTCGYYVPMMWGMHIYYARSIQQLADDLQDIKPEVLVAVPRIFERFYERIQSQLASSSSTKQHLFNLTTKIGWQNFVAQQGRGHRGPSHILWPVLKKQVANKLLTKLGGNLELAISGGAALPPPVAKVFLGMGLNLIQGYGMTECSPVISANRPDINDPQSVGLPLEGTQIRIAENDELQVKSDGVMLGYWNNHTATHETITSDGWLRTGDKARTDEKGIVYITGRIKDILVMSNGEKIPPVDMENAIKLHPLFDNALVVGEGKPYLGAILILNSENWFSLAQKHRLDPLNNQSLLNTALNKTLLEQVSQALHDFPGYAKIRRVLPKLEPWTVENGLLTPTLKTKRQIVMEKFANEIALMYNKH